MTSPFDRNLCPPSAIFSLGNTKSHLGLDLVSKESGQVIQIIICEFLPLQPLKCEMAHCLSETKFFYANVAIFPLFLPLACQVMICSIFL